MNWLSKITMQINKFMAGRYGGDMLSFAIVIFYFILVLIANITRIPIISFIALILLIWGIFRIFSKNIYRRRYENDHFLKFWNRMVEWFRRISRNFSSLQRKETLQARDKSLYRYYKCPKCGNKLRVPKGKGKIIITCPVCGEEFVKKT